MDEKIPESFPPKDDSEDQTRSELLRELATVTSPMPVVIKQKVEPWR